jgi:tetratricopeptide (TPR) repeat protein
LRLICISVGLAASIFGAEPCQSGLEALQRRDLGAAEAALRECLNAHPDRMEPYLMLASAYQLQGNAEALYRTVTEGRKRFPADKQLLTLSATYGGRLKRFQEVIDFLEPAGRQWPEDAKLRGLLASAHLGRGMELLDAGENEAAARHLQKATELGPQDVEAYLNLGRALHNMHRREEALAAFNRVIELEPKTPLAYFHRGLTRKEMGEFEQALADLNREIERNPNYPPSYLVRGLTLLTRGEWDAALKDLSIAAERMPDNAQAEFGRARCLAYLGRIPEAGAALRRAIELDPADPAPLNALVRLLLQSGRKEEADPLARKAAELNKRQRSAAPGEIRFQSFRQEPK